MARQGLRIGISLVLAALLIAAFLWNVDFGEMGRALASANPWWTLASVMTALFAYWLRVVRWQIILRPAGKTRHSSAVLATVVGYTGIALLPARMGDIIRPVVLSRRDRIPTSATIASILCERIFDLWTVVLFFVVFLVWPPEMPHLTAEATDYLQILEVTGWFAGVGLMAGTLFLLALFKYQGRFVDLVAALVDRVKPTWSGPFASFLNHFLDGLRVLQRPRELILTAATSIALWIVIFVQLDMCLRAFGVFLPLRAAFLLVTLSVIGMAIPTPGGVGGFHAMIQIGLTGFFAVDHNLAAGIAIADHAICFIPIALIGLVCIPLFGLSLRPSTVPEPEP
jgi:uncharacterized protein (TIRG00374 family)